MVEEPAPRATSQVALLRQRLHQPAEPREEAQVLDVRRDQGQLLRGRQQVRSSDVRVRRVGDRILNRSVEDGLRVRQQVGVQGLIAADEERRTSLPGPSGSAQLLEEGCPSSRPSGDDHRVEAGDVDAQFQGRCGRHPQELTGAQPVLQLPALLLQVARPVRGDPVDQGRVHLGEILLGDARDRLSAPAGLDERQAPAPCHHQVGHQIGGLHCEGALHRGAVVPGDPDRVSRLPQVDVHCTVRGAVVGDRGDGLGVSPISRANDVAGSPLVALAPTNTGSAP